MGGDHLWDAIAAIGQVLGSVAVFVTLGYLAVQVKRARQETRRALSQGRTEAIRDLLGRSGAIGALSKVDAAFGATPYPLLVALVERAGATQEEAALVISLYLSWWNYRLAIIPYVDELPPMERTAFENHIRVSYGLPGGERHAYEAFIKPNAHPDAARYIDNLLAQPG